MSLSCAGQARVKPCSRIRLWTSCQFGHYSQARSGMFVEYRVPGSAENDDSARRTISTRLRQAVEGAGGNQRVASASGVPLRTLNNYLADEAEPKGSTLLRLADATNRSVDWLLGRDHARDVEPITDSNMVTIPILAVRASAGGGLAALPEDLATSGGMSVTQHFLRHIGITNPRNAQIAWAEGDSMAPTIEDGDMMVIDRGIDRLINGKIYVFVVGGLVVVKRLQLLIDGSLVLSPDNPNPRYTSETISADRRDDLTIEGRVAWYGRAV